MNTQLLNDEYKEICRRFTRSEDECNEVYQEAFSRVWDKEVDDLKAYWFITVRNIVQRGSGRIVYLPEIPDICDREDNQTSELLILLEGDLQRSRSENERICKYIVQQYIKYGSIYKCAKELEINQRTVKQAIDDYINNTSISNLIGSVDTRYADRPAH